MKTRILLLLFLLLLTFTPAAGAAARVPVLVYHHLAPAALGVHHDHPVVVTVEDFQRQMQFLAGEGFTTVTLAELAAFARGELELPRRSVAITFDDGYASVHHYAYPVLEALGFQASVFIIGNRVAERAEPFDPSRLTYASWEELRAMTASGVFTVENHGWDGHDAPAGRPPFLIWNWLATARDLDKVNAAAVAAGLAPPGAVAYPFGAHDRHALAAAERAGLTLGLTVKEGFVVPGDDLLRLRRRPVFGYHTLADFTAMVLPCQESAGDEELRLERLQPGRERPYLYLDGSGTGSPALNSLWPRAAGAQRSFDDPACAVLY